MSRRLRAAAVIARRQGFETLLSPGLYVTLAAGLMLGYFLVAGFTASIDTAGFDPQKTALYGLLARVLSGGFGAALVDKLFAEGPFSFALIVSFVPVFLYLSISSVFRFGQEKSAGAIELLSYGPSDGTAYAAASFLKDVVFAAALIAVIALFLWVAAAASNLVLGPLFLVSLPLLFLLTVAAFAWGSFCSIVSANPSAALAAYLGILLVFLLVLAGSFAMTEGSARTALAVVAAVLQWVSPFYYASLALRYLQAGSTIGLLGGMALELVLCAALLVAGHLVIRRTGVRA